MQDATEVKDRVESKVLNTLHRTFKEWERRKKIFTNNVLQ